MNQGGQGSWYPFPRMKPKFSYSSSSSGQKCNSISEKEAKWQVNNLGWSQDTEFYKLALAITLTIKF